MHRVFHIPYCCDGKSFSISTIDVTWDYLQYIWGLTEQPPKGETSLERFWKLLYNDVWEQKLGGIVFEGFYLNISAVFKIIEEKQEFQCFLNEISYEN